MTELAGLVHDGEVVAHSKWCGGWCVCPRWQSSHCRRHHHTVRASAKEKKGWSAIAGAQLDWEHRKIREKGVSVKAELLWAQSIAKRVDCMRDRGKPTQHSAPWHIALSTHFSYFRFTNLKNHKDVTWIIHFTLEDVQVNDFSRVNQITLQM